MADREATGVGVLDRVMAILDVVEANPMGASELARAVGLSVPTAHRLVTAMVKHGLLQRDADARHHLGPRFASSAVTVAALPVLEELRAKTGETAQLWVRRGDDRLCVVCAESTEELRASLPVGTVLPLSAKGSAAKALLADTGERVFESVSERTPGLCSVSAGVRFRGAVIAAVCLAAPVFRVREDGPAAQYGELVEQVADQLEGALRYR
ncbi:IclR family transcriptional regulator [Amycolatopsis albispora]|uniref:IclR family transcriptional regulator n=1 Tax=Amycolatopsis albispora TaxID=1804986 RepID=UPI001F02613D|nr:helix-turn-helix domain-containing protein [Amycolatopsis albispora]